MKTRARSLAAPSLAAVLIVSLGATPFVYAFDFTSTSGASVSSSAASTLFGIYTSGSTPGTGDGDATASSYSSTGTDPAGGSATASGSADVVDGFGHTLTADADGICTTGNAENPTDCFDNSGGYYGIGGGVLSAVYDTYTFTCTTCSSIEVAVAYTITGSFAALDNGPYCQGTSSGNQFGAVACESVVEPRILSGNTPVCSPNSNGCPPDIIDYAQGWSFCTNYLYVCPSTTSFSVSGTFGYSETVSGGMVQLQFQLLTSSQTDIPGTESESASAVFSVTSSTPDVLITSAGCGCSTSTGLNPSTTGVSVQSPTTAGTPTTVTATVSGVTLPTGTVTWLSSGAGTFDPTTCTLSGGTCSSTFTPSTAEGSPQIITASYGGDAANEPSSGTALLTVTQHSSWTILHCSPSKVKTGSQTTCTATVEDLAATPITPTGTVSFSNSGSGTFGDTSCTLNSLGKCSVTFTPSANGAQTITATYGGDTAHAGSSGTANVDAKKHVI